MEQQVYLEFDRLETKHWWFRGRRKYLRALIRKFYSRSPTLGTELNFCEIGAGTGGNLSLLTEFATVDAIEMNEVARGLIQRKKNKRVRSVDDGHLPDNISTAERYDGVFSLDVIEHVEQDFASIKRLAGLVKPGGYIITTVPAYQWLWSKHDVANHHKRRYTRDGYRRLFDDAGLKIHYASYFNTILYPLAAMHRIGSKLRPETDATLTMPGNFINTVFHRIFSLESKWAGKFNMPFGLSIVLVASVSDVQKVLDD